MAEDIPELVNSITRRLRAQSRRQLGPLGITPAQGRALRWIARQGEPVRMSAIAEAMGIARRSATSVVDDLVTAELAQRVTDPDDRRGVAVTVSKKGRAALAKVDHARHEAEVRMLSALSSSERTQLARLLQTVNNTLCEPCG